MHFSRYWKTKKTEFIQARTNDSFWKNLKLEMRKKVNNKKEKKKTIQIKLDHWFGAK